MAYWLIKTEPSCWSWADQTAQRVTHWDGVRNYQASNNMKLMALDDLCFFYHSVHERRIVGIVKVVNLYYPDPTDPTGRFGMVDVEYVETLPDPVTLDQLKADTAFHHLGIVRQSRLSVVPIDEVSWNKIKRLGGLAEVERS